MKKMSLLFLLLMFLLGISQYSIAQPAKLTLLKNVDVVTSVDNTKIELRFNGTPREKGIIYRDDFLQAEFSDTYINPSKQWINVEDDMVKNIFVYQLDATTVRVRIFTSGKAEELKDKIKFSRGDNKIIIMYNIPAGAERTTKESETSSSTETYMSQRDTKGDENNPPSPPFSKGGMGGFSDEKLTESKAPPSTSSQDERKDKVLIPIGVGSPNIYASLLKMVLALGILLSLLFAGLFLFKKFLGKKMGIAGQNQGIKIITSAYIGPKKSIALVDIAGERIVVGITPNHISMLARLGKEGEFGNILKEQISSNDKVDLHDDLWEKV